MVRGELDNEVGIEVLGAFSELMEPSLHTGPNFVRRNPVFHERGMRCAQDGQRHGLSPLYGLTPGCDAHLVRGDRSGPLVWSHALRHMANPVRRIEIRRLGPKCSFYGGFRTSNALK